MNNLITKYDNFINEDILSGSIDNVYDNDIINEINNFLNNSKFVSIIQNFYSKLNPFFKKRIQNYLSSDTINLDEIKQKIEKFNIFNKIKRLFNKGIKNPNEIIDEIEGKNEEFGFIILSIAIILALASILIGKYGFKNEEGSYICLAIILMIFAGMTLITKWDSPSQIETIKKEIVVKGKTIDIEIIKMSDSTYQVKKVN